MVKKRETVRLNGTNILTHFVMKEYISKIKTNHMENTHGLALPARPVASLSFCQCSACGFTNRLNYCMVHYYNGLVGMFVANCRSQFRCLSPALYAEI